MAQEAYRIQEELMSPTTGKGFCCSISRCAVVFASLVEDLVRRAKADFPLVPLCPVKSMAPVPAIAGMVARAVDTMAV